MKFQICSLKRATALLCAGLLLHHLLTFVQAGEIDDQIRELLTPAPSVPDEENAWLAMQALPERVVQQELRSKPFIVFPKEASPDKPAGVDRAWLKEQMEANAELMRMGAEVLKRPGFSVHLRQGEQGKWRSIGSFDFRCRMALAADFARAQDGQIFSAWSDMMGEMKCFRNITTSGSSLITTVIGSKMLQFAAQHTGGISRFVSDTKVARKFAEDLTVFEEVGKPLKATLQGDFRAEKDILEICRVGGEPLKQMLVAHHLALRKVAQMSNTEASEAATSVKGSEENSMPVAPPSVLEDMEAIKLFNFDSLSEKLALEYGEHFRKPMSTWNEFTQAFPEYYSIEPKPPGFSPSVSAMLQASVVSKSSNFRILYKSLFTCLAQVRLARLALLVKAWRLDHADALPDALEQLIPDYTFALPIDPFDGKPLRYDKSKRLLWSISKSLEDGKFHFEDIVQVIVD